MTRASDLIKAASQSIHHPAGQERNQFTLHLWEFCEAADLALKCRAVLVFLCGKSCLCYALKLGTSIASHPLLQRSQCSARGLRAGSATEGL